MLQLLEEIEMKLVRRAIFSLFALALCANALAAESLMVAAAAGYRKPLLELFERFRADTGIQVEGVFGNMQQVMSQTRENSQIVLVIGDRMFLEPTGMFSAFHPLGKGRLALITVPGKQLASLNDLARSEVRKIGIPNRKSTIFGRAAATCLERLALQEAVAPKLVEVATLPQVGAYVATGDLDAGFVNLTEALSQKARIGGWIEVPAGCHDAIEISAAQVQERQLPDAGRRFLEYLTTPPARQILDRHGL
ncbi:MAG: molybdate ABC transporter substrate-binding protein [Tepidimonas sp.]|uniref:molybdate ABC transporter substrate-binding protein n=1 Tax=Tepidimonas sp. TaxID=2002775 RepID=UPI00259EA223|nr:molybdate ABC transporter substrate-binding protein [Tepidimonas sp.]MDM7457096.1 molybdate ABC transporter substrate-binding protein [Tepidimonas sp.]